MILIKNIIYFLLVFYLLTKDPLYQLQAVLFGDVLLKMSYIKLFLMLLIILIIPFYINRTRYNRFTVYLLLFVAYIFSVVTFVNNEFPILDRLTISYICLFLPLVLLIVNFFNITPDTVTIRMKKILFSFFAFFTLLNCLVGIFQIIKGTDYYIPFYGVSLLGIVPTKMMTVNEQARSIGFFLDGIQYGLFLNFALFFLLGHSILMKKYRPLALVPLLLINIYFTYTRSIYLLTFMNLVLFLLAITSKLRRGTIRYLSVKYFWIASTTTALIVYLYGLSMGESHFTKSLIIRFESAQFILESLTSSYRKLFFGIGYIQYSALFDDFVPDNFILALLSVGGIVGLILFMTIFIRLNNMIMMNNVHFFRYPINLTSYLFFSNFFAFGMFCNYLDFIFMFMTIPILYLMKHVQMGTVNFQSSQSLSVVSIPITSLNAAQQTDNPHA